MIDAGVGEGSGTGTGSGSEVIPDEPLAAPKLDIVDTVETTKTRADMSADLVKPGEKAADSRDWPTAIVYYQALVVARGPASPEARKLAELWALAGQPDDAVRVYTDYINAATDQADQRAVIKLRDQQKTVSTAFTKRFDLPSLEKDATRIFKLGLAAYKKKKWGDALVYYQMGYALSPDLPGFLRELGATYKELKADDKRIEFYTRYLRRRPFGKNADEIRKSLDKALLGTLTITTSLPCEGGVVLNRQEVPAGPPTGKGKKKKPGKVLPKTLLVAPGTYKGLCYSPKYEFAMYASVKVEAGTAATLGFEWAIVVNKLEKPLGRISIENPSDPGVMVDIGVTSTELGVQVPDDGRALKVIAKDDTGTQVKELFLKLVAGQRHDVKW